MSLLDTNYQDQRLTPSQKKKIKPAIQGGGYNYLGEQEMVSAPKYWQSAPDHPETELTYITKPEKDLLVKADLHGSLHGSVNKGPSDIISLNGWGSEDPGQNVAGADISADMDTDPGHSGWSDGRGSSTGGGGTGGSGIVVIRYKYQ